MAEPKSRANAVRRAVEGEVPKPKQATRRDTQQLLDYLLAKPKLTKLEQIRVAAYQDKLAEIAAYNADIAHALETPSKPTQARLEALARSEAIKAKGTHRRARTSRGLNPKGK